MIIHCKACGCTFRPEENKCEEDLLCPLMQIEIIESDQPETDTEDEQPGQGNPAPSDSPKRIQQ